MADTEWDVPTGTPPRPTTKPVAPGENSTRGTRPANAQDARERGLRMDGIPVSGSGNSRVGSAPGGAKKDLATLVREFVSQEMGDQNDLYTFCETGRALFHRLAVEIHLASGELTAGAREMGRGSRSIGAVFKMRRVTKKLNKAGDAAADAAVMFVGTWKTFEEAFEELLSGTERKKPKGFGIRL